MELDINLFSGTFGVVMELYIGQIQFIILLMLRMQMAIISR